MHQAVPCVRASGADLHGDRHSDAYTFKIENCTIDCWAVCSKGTNTPSESHTYGDIYIHTVIDTFIHIAWLPSMATLYTTSIGIHE
jgi:hypothetical protein